PRPLRGGPQVGADHRARPHRGQLLHRLPRPRRPRLGVAPAPHGGLAALAAGPPARPGTGPVISVEITSTWSRVGLVVVSSVAMLLGIVAYVRIAGLRSF